MRPFAKGDTVSYLWSDGVANVGTIFGRVVSAGPKAFVVAWENGQRKRFPQNRPGVKLVTDPEIIAEVNPQPSNT